MFVILQRKELLKHMENKEALNTLHEIKELMDKIWHTHESMLSKVPLQKL